MYHVTFPAQSNRASWVFIGLVTDLDDSPIDLTGCSMVFQINDKDDHPQLTASTDNGKITIVDLGRFRWFFTVDDMHSLFPGTYKTGMVLWRNDDPSDVRQLSVGPLPIVDGVVP